MNTATMFSSASSEWETPQGLFDMLNVRFDFTLDPCSTDENAKCKKHYTIKENGLLQNWHDERVFMNPPYGRAITAWVKKAFEESRSCLVVGLLPARTDTGWWQEYVQPYASIRFLRGRLRFGGCTNSAPFPSAIAIWW